MNKLGVQLGAACVDAEIPVQVVARWLNVSRQAVYYWFTGVTDIEPKKRARASAIIGVLLKALDAQELPAVDLAAAIEIVKKYKGVK
jgi:hypothetical protein